MPEEVWRLLKYWVIYTYKDRLTGYQAKRFDNIDEMKEWANERKDRYNFIDVAQSLDEEEEEE